MVALCNRADHIYFHPVVCSSFFFLVVFSLFFLMFTPRKGGYVALGNGPMNKRLNFGGDPDQGSGYGSGSVSRHW